MKEKALATGLVLAALNPVLTLAQHLPAPSRTIYKCNVAGKVVYSDDPCKGAEKLEIEPTRGMDSLSGKRAVGADVNRERSRESFAEAIRPLSGMNAKQLDAYGRRQKLSAEQRQECSALDKDMSEIEQKEARAVGNARANLQEQLFVMRKRFRELRC